MEGTILQFNLFLKGPNMPKYCKRHLFTLLTCIAYILPLCSVADPPLINSFISSDFLKHGNFNCSFEICVRELRNVANKSTKLLAGRLYCLGWLPWPWPYPPIFALEGLLSRVPYWGYQRVDSHRLLTLVGSAASQQVQRVRSDFGLSSTATSA